MIWLRIPSSWTVENVGAFIEDYGDVNIVKDSPSSAYVEFCRIYTSKWKSVSEIVESINLRGKTEHGITACLHKDAMKYKAGTPLADPNVVFTQLNLDPEKK